MNHITQEQLLDAAYKAGYDSAVNGPNQTNCNFRFFATPQLTASWETGRAYGNAGKVPASKATEAAKEPADRGREVHEKGGDAK